MKKALIKNKLKPVIMDLISKEQRKLAFQILDFYYDKSDCLYDFEIIGELALKAEYRELYLKCAEHCYSLAVGKLAIKNARINLCKAYNVMNYPEKALYYIGLNIEEDENDTDALLDYSFNLSLQGEKEKAESIIENIKTDDPEREENIKHCLSGRMLRTGDTANGILNFIDTFKPKNTLFEDHLKMTKWVGGIIPEKKIYINGEGGIGDELINIRFLPWLREYGFEPILYSSWSMYRPDLVDVFKRHNHEVIVDYQAIDPEAAWTNMMALPGYMGLTEQELWREPYLFAKKDPKNKLKSDKFKIGIKTSGNPYFAQDAYRSLPTDDILKILPKNAEIYYFDKFDSKPGTIPLCDKIDCWEDTLDFIDQMDLIVSSCTSLIHAAGAMGKTSIVLTPIAEYYIWTSSRKNGSTPWYGDNFYNIKQTKPRCWKEPIDQLYELIQKIKNESKI